MLLLSIVLATVLGGVLSLLAAGLIIAGLPQRWMPRLVGFATGVLLAVAFLDILPEALESGVEAHDLFLTLLIGLLAFYGLERIAVWRHAHADAAGHDQYCPTHSHHHGGGVELHTVYSILIGDGFHNLVDGVLIAAAFLSSPALGWGTTLAVIAHEIPQEAGDFAVLRAAGLPTRRAFFFNGLSSLSSILGGVIGYFAFSHAQAYVPYVLTIAAASFLYIAISDLLPLLRRELDRKVSMWQTSAMLFGIALIGLSAMGHAH